MIDSRIEELGKQHLFGPTDPLFPATEMGSSETGRITEMVIRIKVALPPSYPYKETLALFAARTAKLLP